MKRIVYILAATIGLVVLPACTNPPASAGIGAKDAAAETSTDTGPDGETPHVKCESDDDCNGFGAPTHIYCDDRLGWCVECTVKRHCSDRQYIRDRYEECSRRGRCVACLRDRECELNGDPHTKYCVDGNCEECENDSQCFGEKKCVRGTCSDE